MICNAILSLAVRSAVGGDPDLLRLEFVGDVRRHRRPLVVVAADGPEDDVEALELLRSSS